MPRLERVTFQIKKEHVEQIEELAKEADMTRSELIRDIVLYHLGILAVAPPAPKKRK